MAEIVLAAQGVAKVYGGRTLLKDVSLDIARGEAVALLGHNGSGKTTLLRILAGLINPSAGRVDRARCRSIGYVPENFPRMGITAGEYCLHMARIEGLDVAEAQKRRAALFADFFMEQMMDTPMRHLSKGSLQKVGVIQALLMEHDVVLLDEPLSGQDADSQRVFIGKMLACKARGTSLLLSCHEPFLVRRLADRAFRIADAGLHASVVEAEGAERATMVLTRAGGAAERPDFAPVVRWHEKEGRLTVTAPAEGAQALLLDMLTRGWRLEEMRHEKDA